LVGAADDAGALDAGNPVLAKPQQSLGTGSRFEIRELAAEKHRDITSRPLGIP